MSLMPWSSHSATTGSGTSARTPMSGCLPTSHDTTPSSARPTSSVSVSTTGTSEKARLVDPVRAGHLAVAVEVPGRRGDALVPDVVVGHDRGRTGAHVAALDLRQVRDAHAGHVGDAVERTAGEAADAHRRARLRTGAGQHGEGQHGEEEAAARHQRSLADRRSLTRAALQPARGGLRAGPNGAAPCLPLVPAVSWSPSSRRWRAAPLWSAPPRIPSGRPRRRPAASWAASRPPRAYRSPTRASWRPRPRAVPRRPATRAAGFALLGLAADTYAVSVDAAGLRRADRARRARAAGPARPGRGARRARARRRSAACARRAARSASARPATRSPSRPTPRARSPRPPTPRAWATYLSGTVQGAIANVPGVQTDAFGNSILRGGKVDDTVFDYDSVPIPQGLIAEPGGNIVGAQLATTGIASTTVTLAGYGSQGDNALGGVVNQIPALGTYPGRTSLELTQGLGSPRRAHRVRDPAGDARPALALGAGEHGRQPGVRLRRRSHVLPRRGGDVRALAAIARRVVGGGEPALAAAAGRRSGLRRAVGRGELSPVRLAVSGADGGRASTGSTPPFRARRTLPRR